jgi:hypothetical protein
MLTFSTMLENVQQERNPTNSVICFILLRHVIVVQTSSSAVIASTYTVATESETDESDDGARGFLLSAYFSNSSPLGPRLVQPIQSSVDKKNQLDVTFCFLYFCFNSCSTCFGQPCAHHQELTTA